jgi:hypothetical protein
VTAYGSKARAGKWTKAIKRKRKTDPHPSHPSYTINRGREAENQSKQKEEEKRQASNKLSEEGRRAAQTD